MYRITYGKSDGNARDHPELFLHKNQITTRSKRVVKILCFACFDAGLDLGAVCMLPTNVRDTAVPKLEVYGVLRVFVVAPSGALLKAKTL